MTDAGKDRMERRCEEIFDEPFPRLRLNLPPDIAADPFDFKCGTPDAEEMLLERGGNNGR